VESLPISSSGHVALVEKLLTKYGFSFQPLNSMVDIDFVLHGPTIIILLIYFFNEWWHMIFNKEFNINLLCKKEVIYSLLSPMIFIGVADLITVLFYYSGLAQYLFIKQSFLPIGFVITAFSLYSTRYATNSQNAKKLWSIQDGILLGIVQGFSLLPGISRFGATYSAGRLLCGYSNFQAFSISFLIQLPLLCSAFIKGIIFIEKSSELMIKLFSFTTLLVIVLVSILSYYLLYFVGKIIEKNKFYYFAFYMAIPISISLFFM